MAGLEGWGGENFVKTKERGEGRKYASVPRNTLFSPTFLGIEISLIAFYIYLNTWDTAMKESSKQSEERPARNIPSASSFVWVGRAGLGKVEWACKSVKDVLGLWGGVLGFHELSF